MFIRYVCSIGTVHINNIIYYLGPLLILLVQYNMSIIIICSVLKCHSLSSQEPLSTTETLKYEAKRSF